jgi:hypothetical protein
VNILQIFQQGNTPGQAEEPGRGEEVGTADDALGHQELCTVDDEPGEVTKEKHDDNTDKNASKVHLVVSTGVVAVGSNMGISETKTVIKGM